MAGTGNDELERRFDMGEDISGHMDLSTARRPNRERCARRISMDGPRSWSAGSTATRPAPASTGRR